MGEKQNERDVTETLIFATNSGNNIVALRKLKSSYLMTFSSKAQPRNVTFSPLPLTIY